MKEPTHGLRREQARRRLPALAVVAFLAIAVSSSSAQGVAFQLDPQHTTVSFTLSDALHTVRGTFHLKQGSLRLDPLSGKLAGEIIVDAKSGESGSGMRDRKMHREVLESDRYPEIAFHPDRVDGKVSLEGKSSVRVHGTFNIHGADHELTVPAEVGISSDHWTAVLHFVVPYVNWGMKNPSNLFLKASDAVDVDLATAGTFSRP